MHPFSYRPDVDGLRALAVLLVVLHHAGLGFSGGFVGVDIFFVISGYLITGQILAELDASSFRLGAFWIRRIRRILPASMVMVLVALLVGFLMLWPYDYENLATSAIYQQLMLSNVYFWKTAGYFDGESDLKPLLHMWSLAVEEQFYLLYPPVLAFVYQRSKRLALLTLLFAFLGSLVMSQILVPSYRNLAFYLLPTRAWELLLGAVLWWLPVVLLVKEYQKRIASAFAWIALTVIVAVALYYDNETVFPGVSAIPPCLATAVLIYAHACSETGVSKILVRPQVIFVGVISYSWYLWHWPLFAFFRYLFNSDFSVFFAVILVVLSFSLAVISYYGIETPFRKGMFRSWSSRKLLVTVAATALITIASSFLVLKSSGASFRFSDKINQLVYRHRGRVLASVDGVLFEDGADRLFGVGKSSIIEPSDSIDFMIWGDSHARVLYESIDALAKEQQLQGIVATRSAVGPIPGRLSQDANRWNEKVGQLISNRKIQRVLLVGRWDSKLKRNRNQERAALLDLVIKLRQQNVDVSILVQVPRQSFDPNPAIARAMYYDMPAPRGVSRSRYERDRAPLAGFFEQLRSHGCNVIDASDMFFDERGMSFLEGGGESYYWDDHHLSPHGVRELLGPALREWLRPSPS